MKRAKYVIQALLVGCLATMFIGMTAVAQNGGSQEQFDLELELVAEGLTSPVYLTTPPDDDRRFVVDQAGTIHVLAEDGSLMEEPFLDVRDRMVELNENFDERGLLGLAFHPEYSDNGRFYVYYSTPLREGGPEEWNHTGRVFEYTVSEDDPNRADPQSEQEILAFDEPQGNHNGGMLTFGPDGYLYLALGDGGAGNDTGLGHPPLGNGQDITTILGSIVRIDVDGSEGGMEYAIPDDNPFAGGDVDLPEEHEWANEQARQEIYAWGLRNPYRFSFDRESGDMFVADVGQNLWEEVNIISQPGNFGWNLMEGYHGFDPDNPNEIIEEAPETGPRGEDLMEPIIEYGNQREIEDGRGVSVTGGYVYRGSEIQELQGNYVFGDWQNTLFVATPAGDGSWEIVHEMAVDHFVLGFGEGNDGELYMLTSDSSGPTGEDGRVFRLVSGSGE